MNASTLHSGVYIHVANNRNMKSWSTSVFWAGTGSAAEASGQNALSCWGSSAPGGASMYSTSMQMPTVSRASTWPGSNGAGSSTESSETTGCDGGAGGGELCGNQPVN